MDGGLIIIGEDPITNNEATLFLKRSTRKTYSLLSSIYKDGDNMSDQNIMLTLRRPRKAMNFIRKNIKKYGYEEMFVEPLMPKSNAQNYANSLNEYIPGLAGGSSDVYVNLGPDYFAFA